LISTISSVSARLTGAPFTIAADRYSIPKSVARRTRSARLASPATRNARPPESGTKRIPGGKKVPVTPRTLTGTASEQTKLLAGYRCSDRVVWVWWQGPGSGRQVRPDRGPGCSAPVALVEVPVGGGDVGVDVGVDRVVGRGDA